MYVAVAGATVPRVGIARDGQTVPSFGALERKLTGDLRLLIPQARLIVARVIIFSLLFETAY